MAPDAAAKVVKDERREAKKVRFKVQLFQIRTSDNESACHTHRCNYSLRPGGGSNSPKLRRAAGGDTTRTCVCVFVCSLLGSSAAVLSCNQGESKVGPPQTPPDRRAVIMAGDSYTEFLLNQLSETDP